MYLDPRVGARIAVGEAARNVACTGARPMAITNNLNFGNPKPPEVYFQLREAVAGMGEACHALGTPVTGGNVSLYNENPSGAVYPTPSIGMVGLIEAVAHITRSAFSEVRARHHHPARRTHGEVGRQRVSRAHSRNVSQAHRPLAISRPSVRSSAQCSNPFKGASCVRRTIARMADSRWRLPSVA